ncbi:MAG: ABC transporter permease [Phototrophicales bacterium]|nr:MAG: ABC transporter permease [Phototrophicales bacterium]RMG73004.1 MAG: ABC transporter permease [Chloroflexota bacterium]
MRERLIRLGFTSGALILALGVTALLISMFDHSPIDVLETAWDGAFKDGRRFSAVVNFWIPLTLASIGLVVTFTAGLWNIGIEGQMIIGAVCASWAGLYFEAPSVILIPTCILLGAIGGMLWGMLAGLLKLRFGVHEIFGGVALNFIAANIAIYFISGPWQPPEGGSAQSTPPFQAAATLPRISDDLQFNLLFLLITIGAIIAIGLLLMFTRWGLTLRAVGKNAQSALLLGVRTERVTLSAFMVCGALGGIAGAHRVLQAYSSLRPSPAGGIGFLALLVVLLISFRAWWVPFIAFALAAIIAGSTRVKTLLQLDQSLAGVLQGLIVLTILIFNGLADRLTRKDHHE